MEHSSPENNGEHDRLQHPGVLLRYRVLPGIGLSITQAARELQVSRQSLHRIFDGTAALTPEMAVKIETLTGVPSAFWLRLQGAVDLAKARQSLAAVLAEIPRHTLPRVIMKQIGALNERHR
nr:putative HTH-type transcriptional regulator YddM [Paraburkholderia busanensis]